MARNNLDAIIALTNGPAWTTSDDPNGGDFAATNGFANFVGSSSAAAVSGYADITVPAGYHGVLPIGITFIGGRWDEPELIGLAYDFEQATDGSGPAEVHPDHRRRPPGRERGAAHEKEEERRDPGPQQPLEDAVAPLGGDHRRHDEARPFGWASSLVSRPARITRRQRPARPPSGIRSHGGASDRR